MVAGEKVGAVVAAGGMGKRMGGGRPKQFLELQGTPILLYSLGTLEASPSIDVVAVAVPEEMLGTASAMIAAAGLNKVRYVVPGGTERQDTVWQALQALRADEPALVAVHDAVRPFIDEAIILRVLEAARICGAAVPALRPVNTIKVSDAGGMVLQTPDRNQLWSVQTPQAFRYPLLCRAFETARRAGFYGTDDAILVERIGGSVKIVEGDEDNIKITTAGDLEVASMIVLRRKGSP